MYYIDKRSFTYLFVKKGELFEYMKNTSFIAFQNQYSTINKNNNLVKNHITISDIRSSQLNKYK